MRRRIMMVAIMAAGAMSSSLAVAVPVSVKFVSINPGVQVTVNSTFLTAQTFSAGIYNVDVDLLDNNGPFAAQAFCIDLIQSVSASFKPYDLTSLQSAPQDGGSAYSPMGSAKANAIRELWGEHFAQIAGDATKAAAFQVALWEIIYENKDDGNEIPNAWNLTSGRLNITGTPAVAAQANAWLATVGDNSQTLDTTLVALVHDTAPTKYQDYVISFPGGGVIPEPLTMATVLAGLCSLGAYTRKRVVA